MDALIFAMYGNPPPKKRANVGQSIELANELLQGKIDINEITRKAIALNDGPIPYSTHDLSLSIALDFFKQPNNIPHLFQTQIYARMKMVEWYQQGYVAKMLGKSFEDVLYTLYKPKN